MFIIYPIYPPHVVYDFTILQVNSGHDQCDDVLWSRCHNRAAITRYWFMIVYHSSGGNNLNFLNWPAGSHCAWSVSVYMCSVLLVLPRCKAVAQHRRPHSAVASLGWVTSIERPNFKVVVEISLWSLFSWKITMNKFAKACIPVKWIFSEICDLWYWHYLFLSQMQRHLTKKAPSTDKVP